MAHNTKHALSTMDQLEYSARIWWEYCVRIQNVHYPLRIFHHILNDSRHEHLTLTHTNTTLCIHWCECEKSMEIVSSNPLLSQNWPKLLL